MYALSPVKNEELHFSVGEALANIGAGWMSTAVEGNDNAPKTKGIKGLIAL